MRPPTASSSRPVNFDLVDGKCRRGLVVGSVTVDCRKSWNDVENGRDRNELNAAKSRRNSGHLVEEEKKLQEERHRIEEAQRKLQQEAEKLALERRRLEVSRASNKMLSDDGCSTVR